MFSGGSGYDTLVVSQGQELVRKRDFTDGDNRIHLDFVLSGLTWKTPEKMTIFNRPMNSLLLLKVN